jgi:prepilin signal peptidase PulO-like enzyme (type II secretory pathway)
MIVLLLILLGLVLGSFVNALVWRLRNKKDWVAGRSECTHCHHELGPLDLVPVFSWVFLRGKCRYCHKKIEDSPFVEIALPTLFVLSYAFWPMALEGRGLLEFIFWIVFLVGFMALTVYDLRWFLLPNKLVFPLTGLAVIQLATVVIYEMDIRPVFMAAAGVLVIAGIFYALFHISNGTWIGGGDVKLGVVLGILAGGLVEGFLVLFVASVAGMLAALPLVIQGKANRKTQLPFGPFLIAGLVVVTLFGADIIDWYTGLLYV